MTILPIATPAKHILDDIIAAVCKSPNLSLELNKAKVYKKVALLLNELAGGNWTFGFIANLHRGDQVDEMGAEIKHALNRLHKPRPRPADDEKAIRTLKIFATIPELHEIQDKFLTRERTKKLLGEDMNAISFNFKCDNCEMRCLLVIHYMPTTENTVGYTCPKDIGGCGKNFEKDISTPAKEKILMSEQVSI